MSSDAHLPVQLLDAKVRLPEHVVYRTFPAEVVMLNLETGRYHGLNATGGRMLEALERSERVRSAAERLAAEFEQPTERVTSDLLRFCEDLLERGLIVADAEPGR